MLVVEEQLPRGCDVGSDGCGRSLPSLAADCDLRDLIWAYTDYGYRADADADLARLSALPPELAFKAAFLGLQPPSFNKRYSHQNRRSAAALDRFHRAGQAAWQDGRFEQIASFEELHELIADIGGPIHDIGPLTIYDAATRLFGSLGLPRPTQIQLHAGTKEGAVTLGLARTSDQAITFEQACAVHRVMRLIEPLHAENFLCIFRSKFPQALNTMERIRIDAAFAAARSERRAAAWQKENAEAIAAYNDHIREHGLWCEGSRTW